MAVMSNKKTDLEKGLEWQKRKRNSLIITRNIASTISILCVIYHFSVIAFRSELLMMFAGVNYLILFISIIIASLSGVQIKKLKSSNILKSGIKGEKTTLSILSQLPDNCVVLNDLKVRTSTGESQIDNVVITPNGIFVIETKNHYGKIVANSESKNWIQYKKDKYTGKQFRYEFYNPQQQVSTHARRIYEYFQERGFNYIPHCMVFFVNPNAQIEYSGSNKIPVFSHAYHGPNAILYYITQEKVQYLSQQDISTIVNHLKGL